MTLKMLCRGKCTFDAWVLWPLYQTSHLSTLNLKYMGESLYVIRLRIVGNRQPNVGGRKSAPMDDEQKTRQAGCGCLRTRLALSLLSLLLVCFQ